MQGKEFFEYQRALFESIFSLPYNCIWNGQGYSSNSYGNWKAINYHNMWLGWFECAKHRNTNNFQDPIYYM